MTKAGKKFSVKDFIINNALVFIILILAIVATVNNSRFLSINNFQNMGSNAAARLLIALGVSGCLITRGTDLSAGRMAGLAAMVAGTLLQRTDYSGRFYSADKLGDLNVVLVLVITMAICAVFGFTNGIVIAKLRVPPFIATLGMQLIVYGAAQVYTGNIPLGGYRTEYTSLATSRLFGYIPYMVIIAVVVAALMWVLYNKTRHGKYMYAIGGNENAAEVSGVKVSRTLIKIYTLAAVLYALGGFMLGAKAGGASSSTGFGYELEAIASCTIGGVSTTGGVGRVSSVIIGVLVFEILKSAMQFLGINADVQYIVQGLVVIIAVALDIRKYLAKK